MMNGLLKMYQQELENNYSFKYLKFDGNFRYRGRSDAYAQWSTYFDNGCLTVDFFWVSFKKDEWEVFMIIHKDVDNGQILYINSKGEKELGHLYSAFGQVSYPQWLGANEQGGILLNKFESHLLDITHTSGSEIGKELICL